MTIRVTIKNEEVTGGRTIKVSTVNRRRTGSESEIYGGDIAPGESREYYVHAAQHIIVEESP